MQNYIQDLVKKLTLDEIEAQTSVSKQILKNHLTGKSVRTSHKNSKLVLALWTREVYLNG